MIKVKFFFSLFFVQFLSSLPSHAQMLSEWVLGSLGDVVNTSTTQTSFTLGEPITEIIYDNEHSITQGFQQPLGMIGIPNVRKPRFYMPNAFSPFDQNGLNDEFKPIHSETIVDYKLIIYSRWRLRVFESSTVEMGWDGRYKQEPCPPGAYVYSVEFTTERNSMKEKHTLNGIVYLIH